MPLPRVPPLGLLLPHSEKSVGEGGGLDARGSARHHVPKQQLDLQQPASDVDEITYQSCFEAHGFSVTFCVRQRPGRAASPARCELVVFCRATADASRGAPVPADAAAGEMQAPPRLLWDAEGSVGFAWQPPEWLPRTEGSHEKDQARRCVVTTFTAVPHEQDAWSVTLAWPTCRRSRAGAPGSSGSLLPRSLSAAVELADGLMLSAPSPKGGPGCVRIPLRSEADSSDGLRWPLVAVGTQGPPRSLELQEARQELGKQRAALRRLEADRGECVRRSRELEQWMSRQPSPELLCQMQSRLQGEGALRRRCQGELVEHCDRAFVFCMPGEGVEEPQSLSTLSAPSLMDHRFFRATERLSRTEMYAATAQQSFDFDFVFEADGSADAIWAELGPAVGAALKQTGGHVAVIFCGQSASRRCHATPAYALHLELLRLLVERVLRHMDTTVGDDPQAARDADDQLNIALSAVTAEEGIATGAPGERLQLHDLLCHLPGVDGSCSVGCAEAFQVLSLGREGCIEEILRVHERIGASDVQSRGGHRVMTVCADRRDSDTGELVDAARLSVIDVDAPSAGSRSTGAAATDERLLADTLESLGLAAQRCAEGTCLAPRPEGMALGQARTMVVAHALCQERDPTESLVALRLASLAAGGVSTSTGASKQEAQQETLPRRQVSKMLEENARLRAELNESRGATGSQRLSPRGGAEAYSTSPRRDRGAGKAAAALRRTPSRTTPRGLCSKENLTPSPFGRKVGAITAVVSK